jgi:hypothetical protein
MKKGNLLLVCIIFLSTEWFISCDGYDTNSTVMNAGSRNISAGSVFPSDNIWNTSIDHLPVLPNSDSIVSNIGASRTLHPEFGAYDPDEGVIGIPYNVVSGDHPMVFPEFLYADESDPGPYPILDNPLVEDGSDRHILILNQDENILYELWDAEKLENGSWYAGSGAIFNLNSNALRPDGWTSADAAGLPMFPGLVRYDEVQSGEINHALRVTVPWTHHDYVWPARHHTYSGPIDPDHPWMGMRIRLKANFDISGFSRELQIILQCLKRYGMMVSDNGGPWFITGVPDERWNNEMLVTELHLVDGSNFEVVDTSLLMIDPDSGAARQSL